MSRTSPKRKEDKSANPAGHVGKPSKGSRLNDKNRVVHAEEPNRDDG